MFITNSQPVLTYFTILLLYSTTVLSLICTSNGISTSSSTSSISSNEIQFTIPYRMKQLKAKISSAKELSKQQYSTTTTTNNDNDNDNSKRRRRMESNQAIITFDSIGSIYSIAQPTCLAIGPDGNIYIGSLVGDTITRLVLDDSSTRVISSFKSKILNGRGVLGLGFNPRDNIDPLNIQLYVSHSTLFYGPSGNPYTGTVSIISGVNLDQRRDIITGLPVSNFEHAVNGLEFNHNGSLYVLVGAMTNAGVPDMNQVDENALSATCILAHIERGTSFDGRITWNRSTNTPTYSTSDLELFAVGLRNPYDLYLHSNGNLYSVDNGANGGADSNTLQSCSPRTIGHFAQSPDKLFLLRRGNYYGHPNLQRGLMGDTRQCKFHYPTEEPNGGFTPAIETFAGSTDGIYEYYTNNFQGEMRGHLVVSQFESALFDITLSTDGEQVIQKRTMSTTGGGLNVVVNKDGSILVASYGKGNINVHRPVETSIPSGVYIISAFPTRGPISGGNVLTITGYNFGTGATTTTRSVTVGGKNCPILSATSTKITCTVPSGITTPATAVNVIVTVTGSGSYNLTRGYTYMAV